MEEFRLEIVMCIALVPMVMYPGPGLIIHIDKILVEIMYGRKIFLYHEISSIGMNGFIMSVFISNQGCI